MIVKDRLTGRTLVVADNETKKLEILLYSGWVVVDEKVATPAVPVIVPVNDEIPVVVQTITEPAIPVTEPAIAEGTDVPYVASESTVTFTSPPAVEGEVVEETDDLPLPATEPRKARLLAPKHKKTLKIPDGNA